ncbi:hypothetical protein CEXT_543421 [Caerostris extrusa]|uniref:Uncharacterized protein n=1 Tax=Caerostris extrusa TaxID=172846 RepID=A0AAV4VPZ4_CAEEX|nr:hypothetical protein CEXT_543421 [Caerostris extrusa]
MEQTSPDGSNEGSLFQRVLDGRIRASCSRPAGKPLKIAPPTEINLNRHSFLSLRLSSAPKNKCLTFIPFHPPSELTFLIFCLLLLLLLHYSNCVPLFDLSFKAADSQKE